MEKLSKNSDLNREEAAKRFVVYELCEPDTGVVRYVGSTTRPKQRKIEHTISPTGTVTERTKLAKWIRDLQKRGLQPKFVEVEECPDERAMLEAEATLISLHRAESDTQLLNILHPGPGLRAVYVATCNGFMLHNGERWLTETIITFASMKLCNATGLGTVCGYVCEPDEDEIFERNGVQWLNVYVPPKIVPMEGAHPIIDKLLLFLTTGDEKGVRYITHWLAKKVQNPGGRSMTALVFQGQQGTGKNMFASIVCEMIGAENSVNIGQAGIESNFNGTFAEKLLVIADEVVSRDNMHKDITSSALKQYITDDPITVNQKFVPVRKVPNRMSWIFTSNAAVPVKIEGKDDRRYSVFQNLNPPTPEYRNMLTSCFSKGAFTEQFLRTEVAAFMFDLLQLEVDHDLIRLPFQNEARDNIIMAGENSVEAFGKALREEGLKNLAERLLRQNPVPMSEIVGNAQWLAMGRAAKTALFKMYGAFCAEFHYGQFAQGKFSGELKKVFPHLKDTKTTTAQRKTTDTRKEKHDRVWVYDNLPISKNEPTPKSGPKIINLSERKTNAILAATMMSGSVEEMKLKVSGSFGMKSIDEAFAELAGE